MLHPSAQANQYRMYLEDTHTAFYEGDNPVRLKACSYLHNYHARENDVIFAGKFSDVLNECPLYTADNVDSLSHFLKLHMQAGEGIDVLQKIEKSTFRPSKKLMDHVGNVIKGVPQYILLDEQKVVYEKILGLARKGFHDKQKQVILVNGGPGSGKSIIAINIMADLLLQGYNAHYVTGSRAFTQTLRKIIGKRGDVLFKYTNDFREVQNNEIDVLLCDEAHRIRVTSETRWTPKALRRGVPQINELINAAKVAVFFIDDYQVVRPGEIGSIAYLKENAEKYKCTIHEHKLDIQFRCSGSEAFVNWIETTLDIHRTPNVLWNENEDFDFRIYNSPLELEHAIKEKITAGYSARMTAGYCWYWTKQPRPDGTLENDVIIDDYIRPWNADPDVSGLAPDIPKATFWAYDPNGINQVGCIYTAQGFEFDYVGVIIGNDLTYSLDEQKWTGHPQKSFDAVVKRSGADFINLVKNTYRVLLSRGMKGCYVYFMDKETERFFKSRLERQ